MPKYVQHVAGCGKKWKVHNESSGKWIVENSETEYVDELWLPKSEYHEVPAPEQWEDVTAECDVWCVNLIMHSIDKRTIDGAGPYRLRKIRVATCTEHSKNYRYQDAFLVEKRVQP